MVQKVDALSDLKVKGLIVGPIHVSTADQPDDLNLKEIAPSAGNLTDLEALILTAQKKSKFICAPFMLNVMYNVIFSQFNHYSPIFICLCLDIPVVLDLTPNYKGSDPWFAKTSVRNMTEKVKV